MKPSTYVEQEHAQSCHTCRYAGWQCNIEGMMCYHGDTADAVNDSRLLDGDELDKLWVARHVDPEGLCENWKSGNPQQVTWSNDYDPRP